MPDPEELDEPDRRPRAGRHAGGGDVRGGGDERRVAAEAGAEGERPPVGVVAALPAELLHDRDHRGGEGDVVDDPRAERRDPCDPEQLRGAVAAGGVGDAVGDLADRAGLLQRADHHEQADEEEQRRPLDPGQRLLDRLARDQQQRRSPRRAPRSPARGAAPCGRRRRTIVSTSTGTVRSARRGPRSSGRRRGPSRARGPRARSAAAAGRTRYSSPVTTTKATAAIGARFAMNGQNESPVAPAMMMFGRIADQRRGPADVRRDRSR